MIERKPRPIIQGVEMLRAVAVLMVMFQHLPGLLPDTGYWWLSGRLLSNFNLSSGVDIFFCVSGFVVTRNLRRLPWYTSRESVRHVVGFWLRRAFRLWPAAWLWLFVAYAMSRWFNHGQVMDPEADLRMIPAGIGMYSNYLLLFEAHQNQNLGIMSQYWSLSLEEQFYFVLPLLLIVARRFTLPLLLTYAAYRFYAFHDFWADVYLRPGCLVAGVVLAYLEDDVIWRRLQALAIPSDARVAICTLLICLAAAVNAIGPFDRLLTVPMFMLQAPLETVTCFLLVLFAAQTSTRQTSGWIARALVFLGGRSYAFYLTHHVVYAFVRELTFRLFAPTHDGPLKVCFALMAGATLLVAATEFTVRYVEQPLRRRGRAISDRFESEGSHRVRKSILNYLRTRREDWRKAAGLHRSRVVDIEALRTIAVAFVMVQHVDNNLLFWPRPLQWALSYGELWPGVDVFFVISGFLVTRGLLTTFNDASVKMNVRPVLRFWARRAWRLWPTAWLWLGLIVIGSTFLQDFAFLGPVKANINGLAAGVLLYANYRSAKIVWEPYGPGFPYWSLSLEEQFYFILPLAMLVLRRNLIWVVCLGIAVQFPLAHDRMYFFFRSDALLWGVALAIWSGTPSYLKLEPKLLRSRAVSVPFVLCCLSALFFLAGPGNMSPPFVIGSIAIIAALLVWVATYDRNYICPRVARPFVLWAGSRSYALYVAHVPVYNCSAAIAHYVFTPRFHPFTGAGNPYALTIVVPLMLVVVEATHRLVEQPLRRFGGRLMTREGRDVVVAATRA